MKQVIIMPGGFHPFHAGHYALYKQAQDAFPGADVYVAATNDTSARPFPFAVKEKLAKLAGVKPGHFVQVKSPFQAREITANLDPENTQLIFVRSQKDADKPPQAGGVKKNGEPSYLQPLEGQGELAPMNQHAYMAYLPTVEFGPGMTSATEIRNAWPRLNEKRKTALVMSLYPRTQTNPALAATVVKLLDTAMGGELAEGVELKFHTIKLAESQIKAYAKQYFECYNIELPHGKFINNVGRFGSKKLTESSEANEIAPFIQMINSVDSPKTIKVGDYFSVLAFEINFAWKEIYGSGFTTPKEVVDVKMHNNGTISYIKFADGDRYPRLTPATYQGKPIVQTAYFDRAGAASSALTALALKVPDGWDFNTADVEQGVDEAYDPFGKFDAAEFSRHMEKLRAREELRKTDPMRALVGDLKDQDAEKAAAIARRKKPEDDSIGINDPRHPGYAYSQMGQTDLTEFAPGNGDDDRPTAEYEVYQCSPQDQFDWIGGPLMQTDDMGKAHSFAYFLWKKHPDKCFMVWQERSQGSRGGYGPKGSVLGPDDEDLTEFAPSDNGGGRKFIPWPEFIEAVKQIVGKDFSVTEKVVKSTIQDRFIPHDPMEYGPTLLYSYYEARLGRNKGAVSTRGSIQVGKYVPNRAQLGKQNFITTFNLLKGHPFERHFDLTFDNIYKIANIILGNTEGAYQMPQPVTEGTIERKINRLQQMVQSFHNRAKATKNDIKKQHFLAMADKLTGELDNLISDYNEHERAGNEIARHDEEPSKVWEDYVDEKK